MTDSPDGQRYLMSTEILAASTDLAVGFQRLVVLRAAEAGEVGRIVPLDPGAGALIIGRRCSGLELGDGALSRQHARIGLGDEGWSLEDLGSRNGTFAGGSRVDRRVLHHGDVLRLGNCVLLYEGFRLSEGLDLLGESEPLWGPSVALQIARGSLAAAAEHAVPVLLLGESGVGKEVAAAWLHARSGRSGPLIPVNCGALPRELVEAELFGAVAGAWTGANRDRRGLFEAATGGTIFLDEVGELPVELQPKLLRVLAEGEIRRVGDTRTRSVDVRVVAATNRDLEDAVLRGGFRGDLLARLNGWRLTLPPLRERREDILPLARRMLGDRAVLSADAAEALCLFDWPYNVRELQQVCAALAIRAGGGEVGAAALPGPLRAALGDRVTGTGSLRVPLALRVRPDRAPNREELIAVLEHFEGNVTQVARYFGKARAQVYRWCERHGLKGD